jgi:fructosamine-3-kinase
MGEALAALHTAPCGDRFGYSKTNFIGTLEQDNAWMGDWGTFFVERRLRPQVQLAQRILGRSLLKTLDVVMGQAPGELETGEAPCRVHGDLWSGNRIIDEEGEPWVIDPAAFCGNRELDLAMMRLFGGFGEECFSAYEELAPLPPGAVRRTEFYKLYFLLVHVNLHGPSWAGQVAQVAWELT